MVKRGRHTARGSRFGSQTLHVNSQLSVTPVSRYLKSLQVSEDPRIHVVHIYIDSHTHTYKIKKLLTCQGLIDM